MEIIIQTEKELEKVVKELLIFAEGKKKFMLYGEIGAGKTTFVQAICQYFAVNERVVSPTFSLVNEYTYVDSKTNQEEIIHHLDLYRLKDENEAINIGIEDFLYGDSYCFIEWAEIIDRWLPEDVTKIYLEIFENSGRKIKFM